MRTIKSILFTLFAATLFVCCQKELEIKVEFNEAAYEMSVGDTLDFASEVKVENTNQVPTFTTSDASIAKVVSEGYVVALAPGEVSITVAVAGKSAKAQLNVNVVVAEKILLESPDSVIVASEAWANVVAKVEPANYDCENLEWSFKASDEAIGLEYKKVNDSEYKFKVASYLEGSSVTVTVADKNSTVSQTATVLLVEQGAPVVAAKLIRLNAPNSITENDKRSVPVTVEVVPEGTGEYDYANLVWEFTASDAEATGFVYEKETDAQYNIRFAAYKEGANVTVKVTDPISQKFASKTISVEKKPQEGVKSIKVSPSELSLFVGDVYTLDVNCSPSSYDPTLILWESSNTAVIKVQDGKVTAVAEGTAKVKAIDSISGLSSECEINVNVPVKDVVVKSIILDKSKLDLTEGESQQLKVTCYDADGKEVKNFTGLVWSALPGINEDGEYEVVTVSPQGIVKAEKEGTTLITVAVESNTAVNTQCDVAVSKKAVLVEKLTLNPSEKTIDVNDVFTMTVTTVPALDLVDDKTITYTSSNPDVVTVTEEGRVKGVAVGEAQITATAASGVSATAKVVVKLGGGDDQDDTDFLIELTIDDEPEDDKEHMKLPQFETLPIKVSYTNGYVAKNTRWEVSDPTMAKVTAHDGYAVVEAIYSGMMTDDEKIPVIITHYAGNQVASKTIDITRAMPKRIEYVGLPKDNILYLGEWFPSGFRARVYPDQASQEITYWGSDGIASVANGSRTAYKVGYFELNARAHYMGEIVDLQATTYITVKARPVEDGSLSNSAITIETGKAVTLQVNFTPADNNNYDYNVVWESSNAAVASVEKGKVTANSVGTATISAKLSNGKVLTCQVTVKEPAPTTVNVGDYYYADGTVSSELNPDKKVIGVVFYVENPQYMGDLKLSSDHPDATNGLVVALEEAADVVWQKKASNVGDWAVTNLNYHYLQDTERMCGYSNTVALKAYNASCASENKVLAADCAPDIKLGSTTSGWYLPSYAEWNVLYNYEKSTRASLRENGAIAKKIIAAGGKPFCMTQHHYDTPDGVQDAPSYWASTETSGYETYAEWATCMHFLHGGQSNKFKHTKTYYIARYIFAF